MQTKNGFTLLENATEVRNWLNSQKVTRTVNKLQVHHMALPDYACWVSDKKKTDPHFRRTESLDSYGKTTWNSKSANGKYIAQHFNVFPDGKITTGRSLNSNPIGISGWNTGAICVEIYGNFDKGKDVMTAEQKKAVIYLFGELCKKFGLNPTENTIRYHAWFASSGTYLGNYVAGKSRKTCPGTNFFGGNTMAAFKANFLPAVKNYINNGSTTVPPTTTIKEVAVNKIGYVNTPGDTLNVRQKPDSSSAKLRALADNTKINIIAECSNKWLKINVSGTIGYVSGAYVDGIKAANTAFKVKINTDSLNIRSGAGTNYAVVGSVKKGEVYTIVQVNGKWGKLKSGAGWIHLDYVLKV